MNSNTTTYDYSWLPEILHGETVDLRDIVERLEELRADDDRDQDEAEELDALETFARDFGREMSDTLESVADNEPGMVAESYFEEYARDLAEDIRAIPSDAGWPVRHIDWPAAAAELKADYVEFTFAGQTWLIRSW